jgi:small subunit ribosomal protein S5
LIRVPIINETIPHDIYVKFKAAKVLLKPAPKGTGIKVGGPARLILELAGVPNVVGKLLGTTNKISNVHALILALSSFKSVVGRKFEKRKEEKVKKLVETKLDEEIVEAIKVKSETDNIIVSTADEK